MKKVLSVALVIAMLTSLTACGSEGISSAKGDSSAVAGNLMGVAEAFKNTADKATAPSGNIEKYEGEENVGKKETDGSIEGMPAESGEDDSVVGSVSSVSELIELINNSDVNPHEIYESMSIEEIQAIVQDLLTNQDSYVEMGVSEESIEELNNLLQQLQGVAQDMGSKKQPRSAE